MTDRELLELAAKAAGLLHVDYSGIGYDGRDGLQLVDSIGRHTNSWSPFTDDGDALRLAVKLGLDIWRPGDGCVHAVGSFGEVSEVQLGLDSYAATRHSIVRAAAEIGKAMK